MGHFLIRNNSVYLDCLFFRLQRCPLFYVSVPMKNLTKCVKTVTALLVLVVVVIILKQPYIHQWVDIPPTKGWYWLGLTNLW